MAPGRQTLLIVDGDPSGRERLARALAEHEVLLAEDGRRALESLGGRRVDLVLCELRLPDRTGIELLRQVAERHPEVKRVLVSSYADLPEVVRARASGLVARVLPRGTRPENARRIVADSLGMFAKPHQPAIPDAGFGWQAMEELLRWTAGRAAQVEGAVIRQVPGDGADLQLQLVLPAGDGLEAFRGEVVQRWLWPLKPRGGPLPARDRDHPVAVLLGDLSEDHEVYARKVDGEPIHVYLALLPWRREPRVTAAIGLHRPKFLEILRQLLLDVHRFAVEEIAEFPLPLLPSRAERTGPGQTVLEYDWVVTDSYVGPDRRAAPTSLWNRFVLFGRRRRVASRLARTTDAFVDRLAPFVRWYALAYLVLGAVDAGLSLLCVRAGIVRELNPLLRPLLAHPVAFLLVKGLIALSALLVVARFQLFRVGRYLLGITVASYLVLDAYWGWLLWRRLGP